MNGVIEGHLDTITTFGLPQKIPKDDDKPVAFPSWSDERLRETGIANYKEIELEIG